jgi:hypothetical protein
MVSLSLNFETCSVDWKKLVIIYLGQRHNFSSSTISSKDTFLSEQTTFYTDDPNQRVLSEGESSVQLTSTLRLVIL